MNRRYPIGAEPSKDGVSFRVWAPDRRRVEVLVDGKPHELAGNDAGYHEAFVPGVRAGDTYRFRLDGGADLYPDPASRFQPEGPHGPSQVVDPKQYTWRDDEWRGIRPERRVVYEMHVGTFTKEGTFASAIGEIARLAALGVTLLEIMPVAEFAGTFGWGYDGVDLWAPTRLYGIPDDFRRFVDAAHAAGVGVILDVVYNHVGPDGNYLPQFSKSYFTKKYENDWGDSINFDGDDCAPVREFFAENAAYFVDEFHLDGLRFDATQAIKDETSPHVLADFTRRAREAAGTRPLLVAENESQEPWLARRSDDGGYGMDALWNDDFHHSAIVALTGRSEAYYSDTHGTPQELISAMRWGYLFQGQRYAWQEKRRGHPALDLPARTFVTYLENHDQVANSARGARLLGLTSPGRLRAMTALLLLGPATPMLFQGQEFASTRPFLFFADHEPELAAAVKKGRRDFLRQFPSMEKDGIAFDDPRDRATFEKSKLDATEREARGEWTALHTDLLALRRDDPAFFVQRADRVAGSVVGDEAFALRFFDSEKGADRVLIVNLGAQITRASIAEPLLASPTREPWRILWSTDDPRYGGDGIAPVETDSGWTIPGHAAVVLG